MSKSDGVNLLGPILKSFSTVETQRSIQMEFWYLGLLNWSLRLIAVLYVIFSMTLGKTWASHDVPQGSVNSYAAPSESFYAANDAFLDGSKVPAYCRNSSYEYSTSAPPYFWQYTTPDCESLDFQEVFAKDPLGAVFVTTAFIEESIHGYPCSSGPTSDAANDCVGEPSSGLIGERTVVSKGNQCKCTIKRTVTPIGPEELELGFGHQYDGAAFGGITGGNKLETGGLYDLESESPQPLGAPLDTRVLYNNYSKGLNPWDASADPSTYVEYPGGRTIRSMSIKDWLQAGGLALDTSNPNMPGDYRNKKSKIMNRIAGVMLDIDIEYSNTDKASGQPVTSTPPVVNAVIRIKADDKTYRGPGPSVTWPVYPTGPSNAQTYHKVTRYRQGIVINFRSTKSKIYELDIIYLFNAICNALVIMATAPVIVRMVALYAIPFGVSKKIREMTIENISEEGVKVEDLEAGAEEPAPAPQPTAPSTSSAPIVQPAAIMQPAPIMQPIQRPVPMMPPGVLRVNCASCHKPFGVVSGTSLVRCPHCHTTQSIQPTR